MLLTLNFSCTHNKEHKKDRDWQEVRGTIQKDYHKTEKAMKWMLAFLKEHESEITSYKKAIQKNQDKMLKAQKLNNMLEVKKHKLEGLRLYAELNQKHTHFVDDSKEIIGLINKMNQLKKEMEEHGDH
jgi:hypothetical protein